MGKGQQQRREAAIQSKVNILPPTPPNSLLNRNPGNNPVVIAHNNNNNINNIINNNPIKGSRSMQNLSSEINSNNIKKSNSLNDMNNNNNNNIDETVNELVIIIKKHGIYSVEGDRIITTMTNQINNNENCEIALSLLIILIELYHNNMEPFILPILNKLINLNNDRSSMIRDKIEIFNNLYAENLCPYSFRIIWKIISEILNNSSNDWKIKIGSLQILKLISNKCNLQLSPLLPEIIPIVSNCAIDPKKQLSIIATEVLHIVCKCITNEDIIHLVPNLVNVIPNPDDAPKTLDLLLETTFVTNVDASTLALIAPLLSKSLRGRSAIIKRKASRVIDSMCRLVQNPADVAPFVPILLPALDKVIDEVADEEVSNVAKEAITTLKCAMGEGNIIKEKKGNNINNTNNTNNKINTSKLNIINVKDNILNALNQIILPFLNENISIYLSNTICDYACTMLAYLLVYDTPLHAEINESHCTIDNVWRYAVAMSSSNDFFNCISPYIKTIVNYGINNNELSFLKLRTSSITSLHDCLEKLDNIDISNDNIEIENNIDNNNDNNIDDNNNNNDDEINNRVINEQNEKKEEEETILDDYTEQVCKKVRDISLGNIPDVEAVIDTDGSNVCNIEFSLAFGGKILLHNTRLKLGKGRRYGVMGKNGAGKTTLLTNIATHHIDGLPLSLRTIYVQHDDSSMPETELSLLEELISMPLLKEVNVTEEQAINVLKAINFTDDMINGHRNALSGGWKMKLAIVRAQLSQANILLLDEPTNHLDSASVKWLSNYLSNLTEVTCLIVSHDTAFMDSVVTDIIHYETRKLVYYHGTLVDFVKKHPEAKYYYDLVSSKLKFTFPIPERLDGITSTTRTILKMENATFTYPGNIKPSITNASVRVCLGSRVAVLGPNGAGKSTLIKLLVQETQPDNLSIGSEVWKHHNLRIAYVAQHSFHHIEQHLDISPVDYIKWRFDDGVDKENLNKSHIKLTEEEMNENKHKKYGDIDKVVGRRKNGRVMEYECTWIGQGYQTQTLYMKKRGIVPQMEPNKYISLEEMNSLGHSKLVQQCDARIAAIAAGLDIRPLITREIQKHLNDFNLESEFATHGTIRRLSGGQKVKLVLAAAMWNRPHLLVLDEPTNYLDREALGALTEAIKSYHGGVIIISHHHDFTDAICTEKWFVNGGIVTVEGQVEETKIHDNKEFKKQIIESEIEKDKTDVTGTKSGNTNKLKEATKQVKNPRTFEYLSKVEVRKFSKLAQIAGVTLEEYMSKITKDSPEWKLLSTNINC